MWFIDIIKEVMLNPSTFFDKVSREKGLGDAFKYFVVISLVYAIGNYLTGPLSEFMVPKELLAVASFVLGLILSFIGAGIVHISAKLLGGKGDYSATFRAIAYASTSSMLFGWIPWVGIIFSLYSLYLSIKGVSKVHQVGMWRAFFIAFVIPMVIALILAIAVAGIAYAWISNIIVSSLAGF